MQIEPTVTIITGMPGAGKSFALAGASKMMMVKTISPAPEHTCANDYLPKAGEWDDFDALAIDELMHFDQSARYRIEEIEQEALVTRKKLFIVVQRENDLKSFKFASDPLFIHLTAPNKPVSVVYRGKEMVVGGEGAVVH